MMYLYGASGHAKVVVDILKAQGVCVEALVDDNQEVSQLCDLPVLHNAQGLSPMIVTIGNCEIRKKVAEKLDCQFGKAIHPSAIISSSVEIGEGSVVMAGAVINAEAKIGKHCIVNTNASIDHECVIGDYCHIAPGCTISGDVHVDEGTWIGAGATIIQGICIGKHCMVGAGAVVVNDVPDYATVVGCPAKVLKIKRGGGVNDLPQIGSSDVIERRAA